MVERAARDGQSARAAGEISFVVACVLVAEWIIPPIFGRDRLMISVPALFAFAFMFASHRARGETARALGWRLDNFWRALGLLIPPMLCAGLALAAVGWMTSGPTINKLHGFISRHALQVFAWLYVWGLLQQYALQGFINRRAQLIWGPGPVSVLVVSLIFALLHLPNFWLTVATFAGGLLWAAVYQRAPNLFALALSHSVMTIVLASTVPASALHGLRVGYGYFR